MKKVLASLAAAAILFALSVSAVAEGTIKVAASPKPHAEILESARDLLAETGWELEITEFNDYIQPNEVVDSGEFDANYFQHVSYLNNYNENYGTDLVNAGDIHYEPMGIYPGTKSSLDELKDGDVIAVPNDTTNRARALLLLQDAIVYEASDSEAAKTYVNIICVKEGSENNETYDGAVIPYEPIEEAAGDETEAIGEETMRASE